VSESASGLSGAKAGILGGIFFAAVVGLVNWALLEAFSSTTLQVLSTISYCSGTQGTPQACLSTLINTNIPTLAVLQGASGILFGALYGMYFEFLPGDGYRIKAVAMGMAMLIVLLFFGLAGITVDRTQQLIMYAMDVVSMTGYVVITAHFYRRYTREVKFESPDSEKLKITVDGKNYTGKTKTLSLHSNHTVRAPSESGAFKQWLVSGGISVLDARSFETTMRVDGDGLLKISKSSGPPPASSPTVVREKEIHVVVRIPCAHCGVLNDQLRTKCESCGAPLK